MLVYLRVDMIDSHKSYVAYNSVSMTPSYVWRYTNYAEGINFMRTYIHRSMLYNNSASMNLCIL